ncbi:MAG: cytochrome c biogenesis protein CcsA [Bacteroidales bacterium]|nr:cytochrome c biogenesis protein CcsA [Bacteroidales bacterium]
MKIFRHILSALMAVLIVVMAAGTVVEKYHGSEFALSHVYGAWWFVALWGLVAAGMLFMIFQKQSWKRPVVCLLHISALLILLGALLTMLTGQHGEMTLHPGEANNVFKIEKNDESREVTLPFHLMLDRFEVVKYPGSRTPMDFVSHLQILDGGTATEATISMNNILKHKNYRFYQSDYDEEGNSVLAVAHDPWGIGVTYAGYLLLLVSLVAMFIVPNGRFRQLLKKTSAKATVILVLLTAGCCMPAFSSNAPRTLPKESADKLGQLYVQYKGRVCPLQTLAKDFTTTLYGSARYHGLSSEQVLSGWMFYFDDWKDEPISDKKYNLVLMLYNGELLKLYPHADSLGEVTWYSQNDVLPLDVSDGEYLFIRKQLSLCKEYVVAGDFKSLDEVLEKTKIYQEKYSQGLTQPKAQYRAERIYNRLTTGRWLAFVNIVLGLVFFAVSLICIGKGRRLYRPLRWFAIVWMALLGAFLALLFILRWVAGGHVPMAGSFDSMNLLALSICILALILSRRHEMALPAGLLMTGFVLLVQMMGGSNPPVAYLMPVLASPLLSLHVTVIMMAYALLFFIMLNGITALFVRFSKSGSPDYTGRLRDISMLLLYPAVALLTIGIFIGAVWANVSWGTYWSWDPKEVWALITLLVYLIPLHSAFFTDENRPMRFHLYAIVAFLSVLMTYFGVNFLLGGMHSYA